MSVIDILSRVETICRKYDKYDIEKQRELNAFGDDVFSRHYAHVEDEIQDLHLKAEKSAMESNRAVAVATNVEIRRSKARLMEELPKLRKLAQKKNSPNGDLRKEKFDRHRIRTSGVLELDLSLTATPLDAPPIQQ
ncbi:hypothetical protein ACLB2K_022066 [Fragaria x ananassa]